MTTIEHTRRYFSKEHQYHLTKSTKSSIEGKSTVHISLSQVIEEKAKRRCGVRTSSYLPHMPLSDRVPRRRGRIVWDDTDTMGTAPAPSGTFPWMASLFVLFRDDVKSTVPFITMNITTK